MRYLFCAIVVLALILPASVARSEPVELVVQINASQEVGLEPSNYGSGIIVANDGKTATIITANHTIRNSAPDDASMMIGPMPRISVILYRDGGTERPAKLLYFDDASDLAVLSVSVDQASQKYFLSNREILMPEGIPVALERDMVEIIGTKDREAWSSSERPAPLSFPTSANHIAFDSDIASEGFSGGPLLTSTGNLIGMVLEAGLEDIALEIGFIRDVLNREGISFDLKENRKSVSRIASNILADDDLIAFASNAMPEPIVDFEKLHLIWIAGADADRMYLAMSLRGAESYNGTAIEALISRAQSDESCLAPSRRQVEGQSYRQKVVAYALQRTVEAEFDGTCSAHMQLWFRKLGEVIDPNRVIQTAPNSAGNGIKSLLALGMISGNADVVVGLLEGGALPNPFIDPDGYRPSKTIFLYPIEDAEESFQGYDYDRVVAAMRKAGVFEIQQHFGDFKKSGTGALLIERKSQIQKFRDRDFCGRLNRSSAFDWCAWAKKFDGSIRFDPRINGKFATARPEVLLYADRKYAYFYSPMLIPVIGKHNGIIRISRDFTEVSAYYHHTNGGCHKDPANSRNTSSNCWRKYDGTLTTFTMDDGNVVKMKWPTGSSGSSIAKARIEGVSITTPLASAAKILDKRGFSNRWTNDIGAPKYRDKTVRFKFTRASDAVENGYREITLTSVNEELLAIRGEGKKLPNGNADSAWLISSFDSPNTIQQEIPLARGAENGAADDHLLVVEKADGGNLGLLQLKSGSITSSLILRRRNKESPQEQAFVGSIIEEFAGPVSVGANGLCQDEFWRFRTPRGSRCKTRSEAADHYLETNARRASVRQLNPTMQVEILDAGEGPQLQKHAPVRIRTILRHVDLLEPISWRSKTGSRNRNTFYVGHPYHPIPMNIAIATALQEMKIGSRWRLFVRPKKQARWSGSKIAVMEIEVVEYDQNAPTLAAFLEEREEAALQAKNQAENPNLERRRGRR